MTEFIVRPATPEDAASCVALVNAWIDATDWHPRIHPADDVARYYANHIWSTCDVTVTGTEPQGFIAIDAENYVTACYARPVGHGIGTRLIRDAQARYDHLRLWTHVPNSLAQRFYIKMGFAETARTDGDNEENLPDILFEWHAP